MALIFDSADGKSTRGQVVVLQNAAATSGSLLQVGEGDSEWRGFEVMKAIFTQVRIGESANFQTQHALGGNIYLYVFGDKIGQMTLSGLAFFDNCSGVDNALGITNVIRYYRQNRLTVREEPIKVTLDPGTTFEGYLHAMQGDTVKTEERMFQFSLHMILVPAITE